MNPFVENTMKKNSATTLIPSARGVVRSLRVCAAAVAVHGLLFGLAVVIQPLFPGGFERVGEVFFWALAVPALVLTSPFNPLLWKLGLMNAPGWFAWPKPLGFALAYTIWVVAFLGLAQIVQWWSVRRRT